jgi:hypothetical protein
MLTGAGGVFSDVFPSHMMWVHLLTAPGVLCHFGGNPTKYYPGSTLLDLGDQRDNQRDKTSSFYIWSDSISWYSLELIAMCM